MSDDFIGGLRADLVDAAARERARGRIGRAARPLRPRAWGWTPAIAAATVAAAVAVFVVAILALAPRQPAATAPPRIVATITTDAAPVCAAYAGGRLWIIDADRRLVAVDLARRRVVRRVPAGLSPTGLVADRGELWARVASRTETNADEIVRIDPATGRTTSRIAVPHGPGIAITERFIFAPLERATPGGGIELIVRSAKPDVFRLGVPATDVLSAHGILWAPTRDGTLLEIDALTLDPVARVPRAIPRNAGAAMVAADDGLWLLGTSASRIVRVAGHRIVDRIPVDRATLPLLAQTTGGLWTATANSGSAAQRTRLVRIDPDTHRITGTVNLGGQGIHALFAAGHSLLVLTDLGRVIVVRG